MRTFAFYVSQGRPISDQLKFNISLSPSMAFKVWRNIQDVSLVANLMAEGLTWDHLNDTEGNLVLTLD